MKSKKILSMLICAAMAISATISTISATVSAAVEADNAFNDLNQTEITEAMGAGWNLGNSLEASNRGIPSETAWNNPTVTREIIHAVKEAGFKTIRIPISYLGRIGEAPDYLINSSWLSRIKTVVDYAIDEGLYVVINMHGDGYTTVTGGWLLCNAPDEQQPAIKAKYGACWKQISNMFKDYDEHLIFEAMNEEFNGSFTSPDRKQYENINAYTQIFIDTVRQTGGNNAKRWLLICGWNTDIDYAVGDYGFEFPTDNYRDPDIKDNRLMMSVHYYAPWDFCGDGTETKYSQWGINANPSKKVTSYDCEENYMENQIKKVNEKFVKAGYPIVFGEYGCINKSEGDPTKGIAGDPASTAYRAYYCNTFCKLAKEYGCIPVYWDNGAPSNSFGLFNRYTNEVVHPEIVDAIIEAFLTPKEQINRYVDIISSLDEDAYTSETWSAMNTELNSAKEIVTSDTAKDEELEEAYNKLVKAYYSLKPDETYLKEQIVATNLKDSNSISNPLAIIVKSNTLDIPSCKKMTLKFKVVSGEPKADDNIFNIEPYSDVTYTGFKSNYVKFSSCTKDEATGEYTYVIDINNILNSGNNSVNISYTTKGTDTNIQITYCSFTYPFTHTHHHYEVTEETYTCKEAGNKVYTCSVCGDTYTEKMNAAHKWDNGEIISESTCSKEGSKLYKCTVCGETQTYQLPRKEHTWEPWVVTKEATCTENGSRTHKCSVCNTERGGIISATGHNFVNGVCTVCNETDPNYKNPDNPTGSSNQNKPNAPTTGAPKTAAPSINNNKVIQAKDNATAVMNKAKIKKLTVKSKTKKKITVTWKKVSKANGYQVQVSTNKKFNKNKIVFTKNTKNKKITIKKKIKSGKTYYVRVRAYITYKNAQGKSEKAYSKFSNKTKVKVK